MLPCSLGTAGSDSIERALMASVMGGACILGLGWTACTVVPCQVRV